MLIRTYPSATMTAVHYNGRLITRVRERHGSFPSQDKLAKHVHLNKETVNRIERGDDAVSIKNLGKVLAALGLTFSEVFLGGDLIRHAHPEDQGEVTTYAPASSRLVTPESALATLIAEVDFVQEALASSISKAEHTLAASKDDPAVPRPPVRGSGGRKAG